MAGKKKNKNNHKEQENKIKNKINNDCPKKDGDNCLEPGVFNDSDPIGGGS